MLANTQNNLEKTNHIFLLAVGASCLVFLAAYFRLYLGVNLTDEAYYVALPYRFALGDRPFVDELYLHQTAGIILLPFVKAFLFLRKGTDGIILYVRHLYFGLMLLSGYAIYRFTRGWLERPIALLLALFPLIFIQSGIPSLSYNTLGAGFFLLGCLWCGGATGKGRTYSHLMAGVFHALCFWSYPVYAPAIVVFYFSYLFGVVQKGKRFEFTKKYVSPLFLIPSLILIFLEVKLTDVYASYHFNHRSFSGISHLYGWEKLKELFSSMDLFAPYSLALVAFLLFCPRILIFKTSSISRNLICCVWPILAFNLSRCSQGGVGLHGFVFITGVFTPILFFHWPIDRLWRSYWLSLWLSSIVAALSVSYVSNTGLNSGSLPLFLALVISLSLVVPRGKVGLLVCVIWIICLLSYHYSPGIESPAHALTRQVQTGPFLGLRTTPEKGEYLERIQKEIKRLENTNNRIVFYPHFPAGYLFTRMRPLSPSVWETCNSITLQYCMDYFLSTSVENDVAVKIYKLMYYKEKIIENDRNLDVYQRTYFRQQKILSEANDSFSIWTVPAGKTTP